MDAGRVRRNPAAFDAISFGVETSIARKLWDTTEPKACETLTETDKKPDEDAALRPVPVRAPAERSAAGDRGEAGVRTQFAGGVRPDEA
jgi:hypothetical protein